MAVIAFATCETCNGRATFISWSNKPEITVSIDERNQAQWTAILVEVPTLLRMELYQFS